jgi:DNA modification methylase
MDDINFALVEDKRPPLYTAMKYWGKKPHNIWRQYIENYTPKNGVYFDPFSGSAISAFEAVKVNRKAIAFDLNPLTSFTIEVFSTKFDITLFRKAVNKIFNEIGNDKTYLEFFSTKSRKSNENTIVQHFKWEDGRLYELGVFYTDLEKQTELNKKAIKDKYIAKPSTEDQKLSNKQSEIKIKTWFPSEPFNTGPSFTKSFINAIGGNNFSNIWTKRNLYVLSKIFDLIKKIDNDDLKTQLLFGFIQTLHLTSKMCVPRRPASNRPFSTSWGRSTYLCSSRQMEMNPLHVFKGSCFGRQSVESCLKQVTNYLGKEPKTIKVSESQKSKNKMSGFDLKYGIVDINSITSYIPNKSIDFIMTDPPYGGLVQYLDLSLVWLNWLKNIDKKFAPNNDAEITIKAGQIDIDLFEKRFTKALKNLHMVLKDKGKIVFTFHNQEIAIWDSFLRSIKLSGFKIEKVIHQQNRRSGESNVANPYGTSGTDFYIRCIKSKDVINNHKRDDFADFVLKKAIEIIALRNEPTPFLFLFNGLLTSISSEGFELDNFDKNLKQLLEKNIGAIFCLTDNTLNKAGNLWWLKNPSNFIKTPMPSLTDRVEKSIVDLLIHHRSISLDDVIADIFKLYPNGLTPDIKSIPNILKKYAKKSGGKWLYNGTKSPKSHNNI